MTTSFYNDKLASVSGWKFYFGLVVVSECRWRHLTSCQRNKLRQRLSNAWDSIEQRVIDASIDNNWRARLKAYLRADGGYFEHMLEYCKLKYDIE